MKNILSKVVALFLTVVSINAFAFYPQMPSATNNPFPASKTYFCGGGTQIYNYSDAHCHYYMGGNMLGRTDHSDIAGWPTPTRTPNYFYDDQHVNSDGTIGNYVYKIMLNQFNITNGGAGNNGELLTVACPTGTAPNSATANGVAVPLGGGGTNFTTTASLSQLMILCK